MMRQDLRLAFSSLRVVASRSARFRSRNPPDPHFNRKRMLEVCKPIFLPEQIPPWKTCPTASVKAEIPVHPYEKLLANDIQNYWESSKMILFYHVGPLANREKTEVRNAFYKNDLFFHLCTPNVLRVALEGSPFKAVHHLFESSTALLFCPEISIAKVLKVNKKVPQVILLAGIIDNQFYSRNQLQKVNDLLKRDGLQELVQLLTYMPSSVKGTINHHTQLLSHYLTEASKEKQ